MITANSQAPPTLPPNTVTAGIVLTLAPTEPPDGRASYLNFSSTEEVVTFETGYQDKNLWLDGMHYTASVYDLSDCIACSTARPTLSTVPALLFPDTDPQG